MQTQGTLEAGQGSGEKVRLKRSGGSEGTLEETVASAPLGGWGPWEA